NCIADVHAVHARDCAKESGCIVTRVVPSGKKKIMIPATTTDFSRFLVKSLSTFVPCARGVTYFLSVLSRNATVLLHASSASFGRYPSLLFGFSNACPASG